MKHYYGRIKTHHEYVIWLWEIKYILEKPYSLDCDFLTLKKDLKDLDIIYDL